MNGPLIFLAERVGFEPTALLTRYSLICITYYMRVFSRTLELVQTDCTYSNLKFLLGGLRHHRTDESSKGAPGGSECLHYRETHPEIISEKFTCYGISSKMSAFLQSGRSDRMNQGVLSGCFRPIAVIR